MNSKDRAEKAILSFPVAIYHAAHDYCKPSGVEALAPLMAIRADLLNKKVNPNLFTHNANPHELQQIMELTQDERILQAVCSIFSAGYYFLPQIDADDGTLFSRSANLMREVGELMEAVRRSMLDGKVDSDEVAALNKALLKLIAEAMALVEAAKIMGGAK